MKFRKVILRLMAGIVPLIAALAMAAPLPAAAAPLTILFDNSATADNCGKYDGKPARPLDERFNLIDWDLDATFIICPGTYALAQGFNHDEAVTIRDANVTIKGALTGPDNRPVLVLDDNAINTGFFIIDSNVTFDGLVIDGGAVLRVIQMSGSSVTIKNSTIIGSGSHPGLEGILAGPGGSTNQPEMFTLSIEASNVLGFERGVLAGGPVRLNVTGSSFDGTDGGRVTHARDSFGIVWLDGSENLLLSGTVSKSRFANNDIGIWIVGPSKMIISSNMFFNNQVGVRIDNNTSINSVNNKITGNTIMGVPPGGVGIQIENRNVTATMIKNTLISKNLISAARYGRGSAIMVDDNTPETTTVMAVISGNTLFGFPLVDQIIVEGSARVTVKGNDATP